MVLLYITKNQIGIENFTVLSYDSHSYPVIGEPTSSCSWFLTQGLQLWVITAEPSAKLRLEFVTIVSRGLTEPKIY